MARLDVLLSDLETKGGSDLHLAAGLPPRMRCHGALVEVAGQADLTDASLRELMREIVSNSQWREYEDTGDLDFVRQQVRQVFPAHAPWMIASISFALLIQVMLSCHQNYLQN